MSVVGEGPWHVAVPGQVPVAAGEHPRLLFRRNDLPALRRKAATPEGRAILQRLRFLLDRRNGETMTKRFGPAEAAAGESIAVPPPGTYTIGHAAGDGLPYQSTQDAKYAEFGRECFERALSGVRDRDERYSFRNPGGALRAGPVLGWMAVGYDLCWDGWDAATRERFGRALLDYREEVDARPAKSVIGLEQLVRGTADSRDKRRDSLGSVQWSIPDRPESASDFGSYVHFPATHRVRLPHRNQLTRCLYVVSRDCQLGEVKVRFFGDSISIAYGAQDRICKDKEGKEAERCRVWPDTWLMRNGRWQIVAAQDTLIPRPQ